MAVDGKTKALIYVFTLHYEAQFLLYLECNITLCSTIFYPTCSVKKVATALLVAGPSLTLLILGQTL